MFELQFTAIVLLAALALDAVVGDPDWLWRRLPHPVVAMGKLIQKLDDVLNRQQDTIVMRRMKGVCALALMVVLSGIVGVGVHAIGDAVPLAIVLELVLVVMLLAQRSLYEHVDRVRTAFASGGLSAARKAVAMIVGRDPETLDEAGVCRAAIESTAENFSDGVVAPAFWYLVGGLPGLLIYKMVNTADSMIGHRSEKYEAFGWAAARLDDVLNLIPARLSAVFIVLAAALRGGLLGGAASAAWRDAHLHQSPNAGWPEAAMAGALDLALAGPRVYGERVVDDPWINAAGHRIAQPNDIGRALDVMVGACMVQAAVVGLIVVGVFVV